MGTLIGLASIYIYCGEGYHPTNSLRCERGQGHMDDAVAIETPTHVLSFLWFYSFSTELGFSIRRQVHPAKEGYDGWTVDGQRPLHDPCSWGHGQSGSTGIRSQWQISCGMVTTWSLRVCNLIGMQWLINGIIISIIIIIGSSSSSRSSIIISIIFFWSIPIGESRRIGVILCAILIGSRGYERLATSFS